MQIGRRERYADGGNVKRRFGDPMNAGNMCFRCSQKDGHGVSISLIFQNACVMTAVSRFFFVSSIAAAARRITMAVFVLLWLITDIHVTG